MASSAMLTTTVTVTETSLVAATEIQKASPTTTISAVTASSAVSAALLENDDDECKDDDVLNTSLHSCANDPDFAVICAFLQKFAKELGLDLPNFKRLQEWLTNTDEVAAPIRDLHIKLLRKTRKTVHEKSWESAVSKFCFTYSAQDGWEVERFGYKQASLKVKLRILRELLESQFERNNKFRNKILTLSADSLRSQPIGRDRLGHSYWLTQDGDCNLRIYQEHLDEEIWQVVATNRDEFVNLIARLRGNEVVLPSTDIGVIDEDTSSSNSCNVHIEKPPPPVEQDDSQEEETKVVPNLLLKLGEGGAYHSAEKNVGKGEEELAAEEDKKLEQKKIQQIAKSKIVEDDEEEEEDPEEEAEEEDMSSEGVGEVEEAEEEGEEEIDSAEEDQSADDVEENDSVLETGKVKTTIPIAALPEETQKKVKPLLISQSKIVSSITVQHVVPTNGSSKKRSLDEVGKTSPRSSDDNTNTIKKFRPSLLDSKRDKKPSKYEKVKSDDDDDEDDDEGSEEENEADIDDDEGEEEDIDSAAAEEDENEEKDIEEDDDDDEDDEVGEAIEDPPIIVRGEGSGKLCDGANPEFLTEFSLLDDTLIFLEDEDEDSEPDVGEAIEEDYLYISGEGNGAECLVGNKSNEEPPLTPPATTTTTTTTTEPKATFFFGEPGCLKLSPIKKSATKDTDDRSNDEETLEELTIDNSANNKEQLDGELKTAEIFDLKNAKNSNKNEKNNKDKNNEKLEEQNHKRSNEEAQEKICEQIKEEKDVKITEALNVIENNEKKEEKAEELGGNEKNNIKAEKALNENANHNHQSNIKENNAEVINDTNVLKINNKNLEPVANIEPEASAELPRVAETVEFNGVGNNELCPKNQEKTAERRQETGTDIQNKTKENEAFDITKKADETNSKIKTINEPLEKTDNTEIAQKNEQDNLNSVAQQEEPTKTKIIIKKVATDLAEKANNSSEETTEISTKPKSTDVHNLSHNETLKKTSEEAGLKDPQTLTQIVAKPQKCALPEKTSTKEAPTTTASLINRKRRLADFAKTQKPKMRAQTTSESEVELPEEPANSAENDDLEDDAEYIGGKRLKMRAKLTNTEIRKKVEAQKIAAVEETTSSSGEEEALRKRKIISPKRQLVVQKSNKIELPKKLEKEIHSTLAEIKEEVPVPTAVLLTVKQKPTLAEIIEKKLKKTPEKSVKTVNKDSYNSAEATAINATSTSSQASLKNSPITKPLKKNLLTQLRQEESDEEAIPRKRIIGEIMPQNLKQQQNLSPSTPPPPPPGQKFQFDEQQLARATPERITPDRQRKRRSSEEVQHPELTDHFPSTDCVGEKLKKNDADASASAVKEVKLENELPLRLESTLEETLVKRLESTLEETIFKQTTPTEIIPLEIPAKAEITDTTTLDTKPEVKEEEATAGLSGRRSGRRGGTAVIYAELPQPKRTRGGPKVTPAAAAKQKEDETKIKMEATETKCKEETLLETLKPEVKPEAKKPVTTESKEATLEAEDTPADAKKPPTTPKSAKSTPKVRGRKKRDVDTTNIIDTVDSETPVRQSRRIAQQKIREEAERRKLEEIALRTMKNELKKKKKAEAQADPSVPEPSEQSSSSDESDASEIEEETKKLKKKKCPGKDGTWSSGSEEQEEPEEEEEPPHYETDPGSPLFRSDHEFSPESDLEDESQVVPMKRARTARKEDAELSDFKQLYQEEEACQKCGKSDHPEWILLCDNCDKGYHCSCLSPVLFYIPEGDWYCPPCQQEQLILALEKQLQEFDFLVKQKRLEEEQAQLLAEEAKRLENERLEEEKRKKKKKKQRGDNESSDNDANKNASASRKSGKESDGDDDDDENDEKTLKNKDKKAKRSQSNDKRKQRREVGGHRRRRRRAATRGARQRRRNASKSGGSANSDNSGGSGSQSGTDSESSSDGSSSSSSTTDSDDEPIYKLRKRRQINVSYRLNEYDDLINSALKKEMDEAAIAGNLGRGKDITTIIEADKEEQARQKQLDDGELVDAAGATPTEDKNATNETKILTDEQVVANVVAEVTTKANVDEQNKDVPKQADSEEEPLKRKAKAKQTLKKKPRKLTTLDISSEEDNASDEDFKGSSLDDDDDEDTSVSISSNSDSSLEIYKRRGKKGGKKKTRKAARRTARERRKVRKFVVDDTEDDEEEEARPKTKKKRKTDSDYTESEDSGELSELSENMDSADLCDDSSSSEDSDGAWCPSKRKKQRKSTVANIARKSPKLKKPQIKKPKRVEYSDDDVSEEEEEDYEDEDDDPTTGGKGSGKQPRTVPLKPSNSGKGKGKGKGGAGAGKSSKAAAASKKKKKKLSDYDDDSFSDSEDSTRRTRGRRYAYLEDFEDDSSDGGIKPGVKRPDTPPEEREKFIKKQEEIKRMLAEKNAEGAKLAATPRLTPIKGGTRSPAKSGDSLSTVPLSVIRQAKVLDIDYLQRKGESVSDVDNVDDVDSEFDDADLPDDFPEDMDEDAIARMVEEEEGFGAAAAVTRELPTPDEVLKPAGLKAKPRDADKPQVPPAAANASLAALAQMPSNAGSGQPMTSASGLQEPMRKRLPMPTMHPPLLRHQYPGVGQHHHSLPPHMMQRHAGPPTHLLQNALSAPLGQPVHRNFPQQAMGAQRGPPGGGMPPRHVLPPHALPPPQQQLTASHPLTSAAGEAEQKPRGRRKKITPLRDPLQKQQAAAAATAAAAVQAATTGNASDKRETSPPTSVATGVIKTATSLAIAQPPQLYKPTGAGSSVGQPSVITRMPHLPPHGAPPGRGMPLGPPGMYAGGDVARFYGPPMQQSSGAPGSRMPPASSQRHRGPPHVGSMPPHHGMRPSYGPPPPLRGVIGSSNQPPLNSVSGTRSPYPPAPNRGEHHGPQSAGPYGPPPPARHAASHINPYRPSIFGNPNYGPRGAPPGASMRTTGPPGQEYTAGPPRSYAPYGYYPPPPPLTAAHPPPHSTHPPPSTTHVPPTSKPLASTTRISTSNTQPPAVPSSVIVSAPSSSSLSLTPSAAAAAQKHASRAVIKTAPAVTGSNKSTPAAVVSPSVAIVEPRKKLITLETFATSKSPLALSGESSGSRSSPNVHPDGADDSTSTPAATTSGGNGQGASEFSGLVSYFSSQHDDYNT